MRTEHASSPATVDEYIAGFSPAVQQKLEQIRSAVRVLVPDAHETIKYRMPTFVLHENLVHFAAYENHIGFYPTPSGIAKFQEDLSGYKSAKGSVQFPIDKPLPMQLIRKIVNFRAEEVRASAAANRRR